MNKNFTAVVLGAGKGKRMRSSFPKVLHKICGKEMVRIIIDKLRTIGFRDIVCVLGFKKKLVEDFLPQEVKIVSQGSLLGTAHAVLATEGSILSKNILILYGDHPLINIKSVKEVINSHKKKGADLTILTVNLEDPKDFGRIIRDKEGKIREIKEFVQLKPEEKRIRVVNPGVMCFKKKPLFQELKKIKLNKKKKEYFLTEIIKLFYEGKRKIVEVKSKFPREDGMGVNNLRDLIEAEIMFRKKIVEGFIDKGVKIVDPSTTFFEEGARIGRGTVIFPFTFIEKNVIIGTNCSVGPFIHLREGTQVKNNTYLGNFLEVCRSRIGSKVKIKHFGYIGDTTIENMVNIGAGTVVANFDGKKKNKTFIGGRAFVGSDTVLVAPVRIGKEAITGAGSVVTHNVTPKTVVVGVPARVLSKKS
jgi:bifunctional UDP-N-acetylglucosamine pyrophosphorylase/glucosamine-1-phosphate N-acetyltransferase